MTDITLSELERLGAFDEAERTFQMDEDAFRAFYDQTARPVWLYLARLTGDRRLADDLLQETYYRFLRARAAFDSDDHRRHYLFRIATNLVNDHRRRPGPPGGNAGAASAILADTPDAQSDGADRLAHRIDLTRAMERLKPRERSMLWLAYAQGWSHEEIASTLGLKTASLKSLLHRARRRLVALLAQPQVPPGGGRR
jgi:RNA polymerase sigma-70 factor (ECF subfamily)